MSKEPKDDNRPLYLEVSKDDPMYELGARYVRRTDRLYLDKFQYPLNEVKDGD